MRIVRAALGWSRPAAALVVQAMLVAPAAVRAQTAVPPAAFQSGTLSFHGRATVGDFVGTASMITGAIAGGPDLASTTGWVEAPVATLVTGNAHRDRDLRGSMETDTHPTMRFDLTGSTLATRVPLGDGDSSVVCLHGQLAIHGVARHVDIPATVVRRAGTTHVAAQFPLNLNDYRIGGLTKMFGLLRMEPDIDVHVDLRFVDRADLGRDP